jgi:hypothetical protein
LRECERCANLDCAHFPSARMNRNVTVAVAVLAVIGAVAWFVLAPPPDSRQEPTVRASALAPGEVQDSAKLSRVESEASLDSAQRSSIVPSATSPESNATVGTTEADEGCVVFGRVSCAKLAASDTTRARVRITPSVGRAIDVVPDARGDYEVRSLSIGPCTVGCSIEGYADFSTSIQITSTDHRLRVDVPMVAVRTVRVFLHDALGRSLSMASLTDEQSMLNGTFQFALAKELPAIGSVLDASQRLEKFAPAVARAGDTGDNQAWREVILARGVTAVACVLRDDVVLAASQIPTARDDVSLVVDMTPFLGGIEASVVDDATGLALPGVPVSARSAAARWFLTSKSLSDARGLVRDACVRAGRVHVSIRYPDYVAVERDVEIVAGKLTNLGVVRLVRGVAISGFAVLPDGTPASYRELDCWLETSSDGGRAEVGILHTRLNGEFRFDSLQRGVYLVGRYVGEAHLNAPEFEATSVVLARGDLLGAPKPVGFARIDTTQGDVRNLTVTIEELR